MSRCLQFLTAASARPFAWGLYGDVSSCTMSFSSQNSSNSDLNCGPPSLLIILGHPSMLNHADSCLTMAAVFVLFSLAQHGYPEHLSTMIR